MGFSKKGIREEKERILKKGGTFLIKGVWEYKGELILYGKVEEGFITDRTSFCLPRANGKTVRAYPNSLQYNERDRVPYYIEWAAKGAPVILRFKQADLLPDVRVRRWQTIGTSECRICG